MAIKKKVLIVGAGPGGLSAGMILVSRGFDVRILEKDSRVGGRNSALKLGEFTFELGPTFVILPQVFEEIFSLAGKKLSDYLDMKRVDPMYRLRYGDGKDFFVWNDKEKFKNEIKKLFPGEEEGYERWLKKHKVKFDRTYACLRVPYSHIYNYLRWKLLRAVPVMQLHKSVNSVLEDYFKAEEMRMATGFQAKYLGMSPWHCPGAFSILSYSEHGFGLFHPIGGVHKISEAMAKIVGEFGGKIELNTEVEKVIIENKRAKGVIVRGGKNIMADEVIMNADFAYAMENLIDEKYRPSYPDKKLEAMKYSCSTLMLYLGVDKKYDIAHHNVIFGKNYKLNVDQIFQGKGLPDDPAFYIQNPSIVDPTLAPEGKSTVYVLMPVSNLESDFPWFEKKDELKKFLINLIIQKTELKDIKEHIEVSEIITPIDWQKKTNVYRGAVFNLAHNIGQMLYMRPRNRFNDVNNLYLVGGGTHPGSGLPTILESGRIAAELISKGE